jgi:hypothetical protein
MIQSPQEQFHTGTTAYSRESRVSWIGSKLAQSTGLAADQLDEVHNRIWMWILEGELAAKEPRSEANQLAFHIVALATLAERAAANSGPQAAMSAVMRASEHEIDPLLAQNFVRLASSPIFWMALGPAATSDH